MIKLLILSYPVWNEKNNSVNTYVNLFGDESKYEVANIATLAGTPWGAVCKKFFLITEKMILKSIFSRGKAGREIFQPASQENHEVKQNKAIKKAKILRWQIFFWLRELVWCINTWKSKELEEFIKDFDPDVVVVPVKPTRFFNRLGRYVHKVSGKPMVCFVSDDVYTLNTFSWSPLFWIDRISRRPALRKTMQECDILYTLTQKQKEEYDKILGVDCHVITKSGNFPDDTPAYIPNKQIKLVYTGNLGGGRWESLAMIGNALTNTNAELDVYSGTNLTEAQLSELTKSGRVNFKGLVPQSKVKGLQKAADILVHVESFDKHERYSARLSFSTKIVDYFEAGRCILAVGWGQTAAIEYLQEKDAAYVITDRETMSEQLLRLVKNRDLIADYACKGYVCGRKYHNVKDLNQSILNDLLELSKKNNNGNS